MAEVVVKIRSIDQMTVKELREICKTKGIRGYSNMDKAEILTTIQAINAIVEVEAVLEAVGQPMVVPVEEETVEVEAETPQLEPPKSIWEGFLPELLGVCEALDQLEEGHFLPPDLLEVVSTARDGTSVDAYDHISEDQLIAMITTLKNQLPRYQREVFETIGLIGTARPMVIDVDFI